jgi:hypothetical protein
VRAPLPDRPWVPALGALALALAFVGALLVRAHGDPSLLVHAGPPWTSTETAPGSLTVQGADEAFDGQFFYRLGVSPTSTDERVAGVRFDLPALRNARWGYGALAFVASGGDRDLVPWALIGLNLVAAAAVGAIGGGLARSCGRHAAWGIVFLLWPGFAYSLSLDTSELVASAFDMGALLAGRHRRWPVAAVLLAAAVLTRDTTAVVPAGLALAGVWGLLGLRRTTGAGDAANAPAAAADANTTTADTAVTATAAGADRVETRAAAVGLWGPMIAGFVALDAFVAWQVVCRARFGAWPVTSSGDNNLSAPLAGLVRRLGDVVPPSGSAEALRLVSMVGLVALLGAAAWTWWRSRPRPLDGEVVAWAGAVGVVVLLNAYLWSGATAFMRAATEAGLLSTLLLVRKAPPRLLAVAAVGLGGLWALTAVAQLSKLG